MSDPKIKSIEERDTVIAALTRQIVELSADNKRLRSLIDIQRSDMSKDLCGAQAQPEATDKLVKRLGQAAEYFDGLDPTAMRLCQSAADTIDALTRRVEELEAELSASLGYMLNAWKAAFVACEPPSPPLRREKTMSDVRTVEHGGPRIETGATQIGDDWPGVFIRGDNAAHYAFALRMQLAGKGDAITGSVLRGLAKLLESSMITGEQTNDAG